MKKTPSLTTDVRKLIEEARNAELCRDTYTLRSILDDPLFQEKLKPVLKAEYLRLQGVYFNFFGLEKGLKDFQLKAKNELTRSIELFEKLKIDEKSAEAKISLSYCYWNLGEVNEADAILDYVEEEFGTDELHPIYLQIRLNRLLIFFAHREIRPAIELIESLKPIVEYCTDLRLSAMFHNQAGMFYRADRQYEKSLFHYREAIRFAEKAVIPLFVAINYNNLAFLFKSKNMVTEARAAIADSIDRFRELKHFGNLAHALDTQANIELDAGDHERALTAITSSIDIFEKGEDYRGYCEALWTKILIVKPMDKQLAASIFSRLYNVAETNIGGQAAERYSEKFVDDFYLIKNLPLTEEVSEFKKNRVSEALIKSKGAIKKAAVALGLKSHQVLSEILNKQFPTLYGDLGFTRRARRVNSKRTVILEKSSIHEEKEIVLLEMPGKSFSFDFYIERFSVFYFDQTVMNALGKNFDAVIAVAPVVEFEKEMNGMNIVLLKGGRFILTEICLDEFSGVYYYIDEFNEWIPLKLKENVVGIPVGCCPLTETETEFIKFSKI